MKRILCCIFALILLLPCLAGCKFMTLSDAEAKAELEKLLPEAKELTEIFYGQGLPYIPLAEDSTDYYAYVSSDSPYKTIGEAAVKMSVDRLADILLKLKADNSGVEVMQELMDQ